MVATRRPTVSVKVGNVLVGGGAPVVVQSMTNTDTADAAGTAKQCIELAQAGSEMVRVTVNVPEAAAAVPEIKRRMLDAGCEAPLIGDFHYNGHVLLTKFPAMAKALDKYRINPGNVGTGRRRDEQFATICSVAIDHGKPVPGLSDATFKGKVTLVNVWASWCIPCHDEVPFLEALAKDKRVQLVGINYKDAPADARRFLGRYGNPYAASGTDRSGRESINWGVYGVPETYLITRDGRIAYKLVGPIDARNLTSKLAPEIDKALAKSD